MSSPSHSAFPVAPTPDASVTRPEFGSGREGDTRVRRELDTHRAKIAGFSPCCGRRHTWPDASEGVQTEVLPGVPAEGGRGGQDSGKTCATA